MQFNESQTKISIARAFAGLCQDSARYLFMAKDAHDDNKITFSLERAGIIEEYEGKNLFAQFVRVAIDEGFKEIAGIFELIGKVSHKHSQILKTLALNYNKRQLYNSDKPLIWTCSNCGHSIEDKKAWQTCPLCKKTKGYVKIPEEKLTSGE